ncbi:hypothetical protein H5410_045787 [Solanum commersonii]|uniref:Uncharacterized protein n=1 Tax=Solanum commersonii TaxID=4109 RepID=A0A9J5XAH8_SOLCO|nr:hypothetical protein H5410_045787 [Solanum commersonii]
MKKRETAKDWVTKVFGPVLQGEQRNEEQIEDETNQHIMAYNETTLMGINHADQQQHHEVVSLVHVHVGKEVVQNVSSNPRNTIQEEESQFIGEGEHEKKDEDSVTSLIDTSSSHVSHSKLQRNQYEKKITKENKGQFIEVSQQSETSNILRNDKEADKENELAILAFPVAIEQDSQGEIF